MDKNIFKFIFRYTRPQQIYIFIVILIFLPFYYIFLDIPKLIVNTALESDNPEVNGDEFPRALQIIGIDFGDYSQLTLLFTLCVLFLVLVCINASFRMYINIYKGRLGERMLRRLRYILYCQILRFPLTHFRKVSSGELIPMVTSEVAPFGNFMGDAFVLPALQGGLLLTAIFYIFLQDPLMGTAAILLYPIQAYFIPKFQHRVNKLIIERVSEVRKLSEQVGESVAGVQEIHAHGTAKYELASFSQRLGKLYAIRYQIYNQKLLIKFINGFLSQLTPILFFTIGGYFVVLGELTLGSLVAVLAAYTDLSPPWKKLLQFYQVKEDMRIKYEQVVKQFHPPDMSGEDKKNKEAIPLTDFSGELTLSNLSLHDEDQTPLLSNISIQIPLHKSVAIVGSAGSGKEELMLVIARLIEPTSGRSILMGQDYSSFEESFLGKKIGFVDQNPYIFSKSIKENLFYGLKNNVHIPDSNVGVVSDTKKEWVTEAARTGNSTQDINVDWVDYNILDLKDSEGAIKSAIEAIKVADMSDDIYQLGLRGSLNTSHKIELEKNILKARITLRKRLLQSDHQDLVEPFDYNKYNNNATLAENLIFGTPCDESFKNSKLAEHPYVLNILEKSGLTHDLLTCGHQIARTMIELFSDFPPEHELFQRFSFIKAEGLSDYQELMNRVNIQSLNSLDKNDQILLLSLTFNIVASKHKLSAIDSEIKNKIVVARKLFHERLPSKLARSIDLFNESNYNSAATVQDNILFGKVIYGQAEAKEKVGKLISEVVNSCELYPTILEVGLDYYVGISGRRLSSSQRQKLAIARCIIKKPHLLIISEATANLENTAQKRIIKKIKENFFDRGVIWSLHRAELAEYFEYIFVMKNGSIVAQGSYEELIQNNSTFRELIDHD